MNVHDQLILDYSTMALGETIRGELCPACQGGSTGERTFTITNRDGVLLWICHRASCQFKGASGQGSNAFHTSTQAVPTRGVVGRTFARQSTALEQTAQQLLEDKYGLDGRLIAKHGIGWDVDSSRLCLPVRDYQGNELGVTLRTISNQKPKSLTHTEPGAMAWYPNHTAAGVIVVEDQLSAIRASDYLCSVALLGTNLNDERVDEIKATGLAPVYLALDADAWHLTVRYCIKYRSALKLIPVKLPKDIKNMSNQELKELMIESVHN